MDHNAAMDPSERPVLYYFYGRGRAEPIRWMLAAGGIDFDEVFLTSRDQYLGYVAEKKFLYEQVPMLEIDGIKLAQTNAILHYIARKCDMYGRTHQEQAYIDMYAEGIQDGFLPLIGVQFKPEERRKEYTQSCISKLKSRYLPVFEKAVAESPNNNIAKTEKLSMADVLLLDGLLLTTEIEPDILDKFDNLKHWLEEMQKLSWVKKFLSPDGKRKPMPDKEYVDIVRKVLYS